MNERTSNRGSSPQCDTSQHEGLDEWTKQVEWSSNSGSSPQCITSLHEGLDEWTK